MLVERADLFFSFNLGQASNGDCQAALGSADLGFGDGVWLLGDTYVLSYGPARVHRY